MSTIDQYLQRSNEIIGERTREEERYDDEVLKSLEKYGKIRKALNKANKKFPEEAMKYDDSNIADIAEHYEYLLQHSRIVNKL